jgi:hypothetical protein
VFALLTRHLPKELIAKKLSKEGVFKEGAERRLRRFHVTR